MTLGVITPHAAAGPEVEWPVMTSQRVNVRVGRIPAPGGVIDNPGPPPAGPEALRALATPAALTTALTPMLTGGGEMAEISAIGYASTTTGYLIGPEAERVLLDEVAQLCGLPVAGTAAAATEALKALGATRLAVLHPPWFDQEMQDLGAAYFRLQGFDIVASTGIHLDVTPQRPDLDKVATWIPAHVPDTAQALLIGGNGFRAASLIHRLERELGRPVTTANQVLLWYLLPPASRNVAQHGSLFAR